MSDENITLPRSWQEIAAEAAQETDPKKLLELSKELCAAFDARDEQLQQMKTKRRLIQTPSSRNSV